MKQRVTILLLLFTIIKLSGQGEQIELSLDEAVKKAIIASPDVRKLALADQKNDYELKSFRSAFLPQVSGQLQLNFNPVLPTQRIPDFFGGDLTKTIPVQFGTFQSHQATVSVNQVIYSKALQTGSDVLKKTFELNSINQQMKNEELTNSIAKLYFQTQGLQFQIKNVQANIDNLQKLVEVSKARQEVGLGLGIDTDRIQINLNNLKSQIEILKSQEQSLMDIINILTGQKKGTKLTLTTTDLEEYDGASAYLDADRVKNRTLDLLDKQKEVLSAQINSNLAQNGPTLAAFAQMGGQIQGDKLDIFIKKDNYAFFGGFGLQLNVPIYNGKKYQNKVKSIELEMMQIDEDKNLLKQGLEQQYVNAFQTLYSNKQQKNSQDENVALAQRTYAITQDRYNQGVAPLTDLMDAQKSLIEAQNMALLTDLQIKLAQIDLLNIEGNIQEIIR